MNNQRYTDLSKQLESKIPTAFVANSTRFASTDVAENLRNYCKYREAARIRFWLYLDFYLEPSKGLSWIEAFCKVDQLEAEKAFSEIYEFIRRTNFFSYSISQFKAALGKRMHGKPVHFWFGPLWHRVEELLVRKYSGLDALVKETLYIALIRDIVQWTRLSSKLKLENSQLEREAYDRFEANELRLRDLWSHPDPVRDEYLKSMSRIVDSIIDQRNFQVGLGHHGSGAVFEKDCGRHAYSKHKHLFKVDDRTMFFDKRFSFDLNPMGYESFNLPQTKDLSDVCRASTVPKNIEKVRMIAMQAVARMYRQQAILDGYYEQWLKQPYLKSHFPIFDRRVNQRLAKLASRMGDRRGWCTLDLQSASDSVTVHLVKAVMKGNLRAALLSCRSKSVGDVKLEATYATMGDATVFPTETLLIGAAVQLALDLSRMKDPYLPNFFLVFGDDIIAPNAPLFLETLHDIFKRIGFIINDDKSFINGPYRESCGVEAYLGYEIQPWYCRIPSEGKERLESLIGAANTCLDRGYRYVRRYLLHAYAEGCKCSFKLLPFTENREDSSRFHTDKLYYDLSYVRCVKTPNGELAIGQFERRELKPVTRISSEPAQDEASLDEAYKLTQWLYAHRPEERESRNEQNAQSGAYNGRKIVAPSVTTLRSEVEAKFHKSGQHDLILRKSWTSVEDLQR